MYIYVILTLLGALLMSWLVLPQILLVSHKKQLYDLPDKRKIHNGAVPRLGGVAFMPVIYISVLSALFALYALNNNAFDSVGMDAYMRFSALGIGLMLLYLVGLKDDLMGVGYKSKFLIQIIASSLFPLSGLYVDGLYGMFGIERIPFFIGAPFTVLISVYITNSFNLIDGIDGLASGLSMISVAVMGTLFTISGMWIYAILSFAILGCLMPFFYMNVHHSDGNRRKLFMGDTGSLTLGYLMTFLLLNLGTATHYFNPLQLHYHYIAVATLLIPLLDVLRVVFVRIKSGKPPFKPDKNHIHHKCLRAGMNGTQVIVFLFGVTVLYVLMNVGLRESTDVHVVLICDLFVWFIMHILLNKLIKRRKRKESEMLIKQDLNKDAAEVES